jgi:hypothetical protein
MALAAALAAAWGIFLPQNDYSYRRWIYICCAASRHAARHQLIAFLNTRHSLWKLP